MPKRPSSLRSHAFRSLQRVGPVATVLQVALLLASADARAGARVVSLSRRATPAPAAPVASAPPAAAAASAPAPAASAPAASAPASAAAASAPAPAASAPAASAPAPAAATPAAAASAPAAAAASASASAPAAAAASAPAAATAAPVAPITEAPAAPFFETPIAPIAPLVLAPELPSASATATATAAAATAPALAAAPPPPLPEAVAPAIAPATTALSATAAPLANGAPGAVQDSTAPELAGTQPHGTGVWLSSSAGLVRRSLDFSQDVYHRMRSIGANLYVLRLGAEVYPSFRSPELDGKVGLIAGYEAALAGSVRDANYSGSYPLHQSELFGGLRVRHALSRVVIGGNLTLGRLSSGLDDHGAANTPAVRYSEVRTGIDASFRLPRGFRARASVGFRVPLAYGEISSSDWFPRIGGYGFDVAVDADYALSQSVALTASTSLRRYVLEMNSEPEDASSGIAEVAGGAIDAYLGAYLGVLIFL